MYSYKYNQQHLNPSFEYRGLRMYVNCNPHAGDTVISLLYKCNEIHTSM